MRENRTSGSMRGAPGNRRSYCERAKDVSIVVSQLRDMNCVFGNFINKSVFISYSPGPVT